MEDDKVTVATARRRPDDDLEDDETIRARLQAGIQELADAHYRSLNLPHMHRIGAPYGVSVRVSSASPVSTVVVTVELTGDAAGVAHEAHAYVVDSYQPRHAYPQRMVSVSIVLV